MRLKAGTSGNRSNILANAGSTPPLPILGLLVVLLAALLAACAPAAGAGEQPAATLPSSSPTLGQTYLPASDTPVPPTPAPTERLAPPTLSPSPTTQATLTPTDPSVTTLLFTGNIVPARCVQARIDDLDDYAYPYEDVREIIQGADLAVGVLNATLSDIPERTGCVRTYILVGDPRNADALARAGFDMMSVATNHIKDCGAVGCGDKAFLDTLENLRRVGIAPVGAGRDHAEAVQPVAVTLNGVRFGFVSLGQLQQGGVFAGPDTPGIAVLSPDNISAAIEATRQIADVVIAMPHWGPEDVSWPNYLQRDLAQQLVAAGADLVVGNHTHVVQAVQEISNVPVFYGLGNFVFDQGLRTHQQAVILLVRFQGARLLDYEFIPTVVDRSGRVRLADKAEAAEIFQRIQDAGRDLR